MIGLIQRVSHASVRVDNQVCGEIDQGILLLLAVEPQDSERHRWNACLRRCSTIGCFSDADGKMNLSLRDIQGGLARGLAIYSGGEYQKGSAPELSPRRQRQAHAEALYNHFATRAKAAHTQNSMRCFWRRYAGISLQRWASNLFPAGLICQSRHD